MLWLPSVSAGAWLLQLTAKPGTVSPSPVGKGELESLILIHVGSFSSVGILQE